MTGFLTEFKAMIPKALSLDRMVMVALFGVPSLTPLDELWAEEGRSPMFRENLIQSDTQPPVKHSALSLVFILVLPL